jgi:hypothetical protein
LILGLRRGRTARSAQRSSQSLSLVSPEARASATAPTARMTATVASLPSLLLLAPAISPIAAWSRLA